jgi:hypothetical protein
MSIFIKALNEIKYRIPDKILRIAFVDKSVDWRNNFPISLDEQIMNKVIRPRVLVDCDLVGGMEINVPLSGVQGRYLDNYSVVYNIPPDLVMNRTIISVLSVNLMNSPALFGGAYNGVIGQGVTGFNSDVSIAAQKISDSYGSMPIMSSARAELVGHNSVVVRDQSKTIGYYSLKCVVGNEGNLNNINIRAWSHFATLCELAVKSYIYNTLLIAIDQTYLEGGQELGAVKGIIESYSDAENMYQTYKEETWAAVSFMQDQMSHNDLIRLQINTAI